MHWDFMTTPLKIAQMIEVGLFYAIHDVGEDAEAAHVIAMHFLAIEANL